MGVINKMCKHGTHTYIKLNKPRESGRIRVPIDSCIASEVQYLNNMGVVTLGSCCGHGVDDHPPHVLIENDSVNLIEQLGYFPTPYIYANGDFNGTHQVSLKH